MPENTKKLFGFALSILFYAGICLYAAPLIPKDGWWILLKFSAEMGGPALLAGAGIIAAMAALQYTGFHHGKKADPMTSINLYFGGYLVMAAALAMVMITAFAHLNRIIMYIALFGVAPLGVLLIVIAFFYNGAAHKPDPDAGKDTNKQHTEKDKEAK